MPIRQTRRIWSREPTTRRKYCIDITKKRQTDNDSVLIYPCHKGPDQKFQYNRKTRQIRNVYSNKCLDICEKSEATHKCKSSRNNQRKFALVDDSPYNPIIIVEGKCNSRKKTQKWKRSKGRWRSVYNKKCIDVEGGQYVNGRLISWKCHSGPNQKFSK
jgi:hypothetical protein